MLFTVSDLLCDCISFPIFVVILPGVNNCLIFFFLIFLEFYVFQHPLTSLRKYLSVQCSICSSSQTIYQLPFFPASWSPLPPAPVCTVFTGPKAQLSFWDCPLFLSMFPKSTLSSFLHIFGFGKAYPLVAS